MEQKTFSVLKDKACAEIKKLCQKMENATDIPKADWEALVLALKAYEKLLNIEHMENKGYSGYDGDSKKFWEEVITNASPRHVEYLERMMRNR